MEIEAAFEEQVASMGAELTEADLLHAYQCSNVDTGKPEADALLAEIERRGLDA